MNADPNKMSAGFSARGLLFFSVAVLASASAASGQSVTYDATSDFSLSANPNGTWTYGVGMPGGSFIPFATTGTACFEAGFYCWTDNGYVPLIGKNTNSVAEVGGTHVFPAGALIAHPAFAVNSNGPNWAILRWTSPGAGSISYNGSFVVDDSGQDNTEGAITSVMLGGLAIESGLLHGPYGTAIDFTGSGSVSAGETLDAAVGPSPDGNYYFLPTGIGLSVNFIPGGVPEPATWALLIAGFGLVGSAMRTKPVRATTGSLCCEGRNQVGQEQSREPKETLP